ncbi:MAG: phage major tail protein, TP901-1 family [Raoultibacter sp.]
MVKKTEADAAEAGSVPVEEDNAVLSTMAAPLTLEEEGNTMAGEVSTAFDSAAYCNFDANTTNATHGSKVLLCVFNKQGDKLLSVAGQRDYELSVEASSTDASSKDSNDSWGAEMPGIKNWSISTGGLVVYDEESQKVLIEALVKGDFLCVKTVKVNTDGKYKNLYGGLVSVPSYKESASKDDMVTFSAELKGVGKLNIFSVEANDEIASAAPSNR